MDFWTNPSILFAFVVMSVIGLGLVVHFRKPTLPSALAEEVQKALADAQTKCVCGEPATDPVPVLQRGRGAWDWLRNLYGAPPRYTRVVDHMRVPVLCRAHVHVADAKLDEFIFGIRAEYSKLNADIAGRAAGFEQEFLMKQIGDSLTEKQKRATRQSAAPVRLVTQKNGTDGENDG